MICSGNNVIYTFKNDMEPSYEVEPGQAFQLESNDCFFQQVYKEEHTLTEIDHDKLNPATGPFYVKGAEVGDILVVDILDIEVADKGVAAVLPGGGVLGDQVKNPIVKVIEIVDKEACIDNLRIPIDPMIGVIGVAPKKEDGDWNTDTPWKHGGNMDTKDIKKGTRLYFQVNVDGALLALGDCHAIMGDGEACFTGLEIPALVTLKTSLIKNTSIDWPILENKDSTMIIASGDTVDDAIYEATSRATEYIMKALDISWEEAYVLVSLTVDIRISQLVDPKITVRAVIPKRVVSTEKILALI